MFVAMKEEVRVCLKQPIWTPRLVLVLKGAKVRGFRSSSWAGAGAKGFAMTRGSRREKKRRREYISSDY